MKNHKLSHFTAGMLLAVFCVTAVTGLSYSSAVNAQPGSTPPDGNVHANFSSVTSGKYLSGHGNLVPGQLEEGEVVAKKITGMDTVIPGYDLQEYGGYFRNAAANSAGVMAFGYRGIFAQTTSLDSNGIGGDFIGNNMGINAKTVTANGNAGWFSQTVTGTSARLATPDKAIYAQGDVQIDGHLRIDSIGNFHTANAGVTASVSAGNTNSSVVSCPANQVLISCGYKLCNNGNQPCNDPAPGLFKIAPSKIVIDDTNNQCIVGMQSYDTVTRYFAAQARCFNPKI